jgi:sigma-E factor negative regulatory protein RseC
MYEHAVVTALKDTHHVAVSCGTQACTACKGNMFCQTKGRIFSARLASGLQVSVGDTVELYLPPAKTVTASLITLLVPLLLFPVGYYLPLVFADAVTEPLRIVAGFAGIAVGFLGAGLFSKVYGERFMPSVTRIVPPDPEDNQAP